MEITFAPTLKQHLMFEYFKDKETTEILYGGGLASGKSFGICALMVMKCLTHKGIRVGLARNELTTLKRTTVVSLFEVLNAWNLKPEENYTYNSSTGEFTFSNNSKIILLELSYQPSDPEYTRLGGQLLTWGCVDEAGECDEKGKQIFQSRLGRWKNKEYGIKPILYMTCNPSKNFLYRDFFQPNNEGTLPTYRKFIQALLTDNPYNSEEYFENLKKTLSFSDKQRLIHGDWDYSNDPTALLEYEDITNIFTKDRIEGNPNYYISADIAFTSDAAVIMIWEELTLIQIIINPASIEETIKTKAKEFNVKSTNIAYDSDGVGKYLMNYIPNAKAIVNNGKALNGENYQNLKTQMYFKLCELIKNNKVKILVDLPHKDKIIEELSVIKHKPNETVGKLEIISKAEVKRLIGRSPDFSDAMAYRMIFELKAKGFNFEIINFNF